MAKRMQQGHGEEIILASPNASNRMGILRTPGQKGLILQESTGKPVARDSNQNDAASSSQVCQIDAGRDESTRRLVATGTHQDLLNFRGGF